MLYKSGVQTCSCLNLSVNFYRVGSGVIAGCEGATTWLQVWRHLFFHVRKTFCHVLWACVITTSLWHFESLEGLQVFLLIDKLWYLSFLGSEGRSIKFLLSILFDDSELNGMVVECRKLLDFCLIGSEWREAKLLEEVGDFRIGEKGSGSEDFLDQVGFLHFGAFLWVGQEGSREVSFES